MANKVFNVGPNATMELSVNTNFLTYNLYGKGNLRNCSFHFTKLSSSFYREIYIEGQFDKIEDGCFDTNYTKSIYVVNNGCFKAIGDRCFRSYTLENFTMPESVEYIGHDNFCGVFSTFNIPSLIKEFPTDNLKDCHKLTTITVSENNTAYRAVDGILYNREMTAVVFCPNAKTGVVVLPNTVKHIGEFCFYGCKSLDAIIFPSSIETIGDYAFSNFVIEKLSIPNSVNSIGEGCFKGAIVKQSLKMSNQITFIPDYSFFEASIDKLIYTFNNIRHIGKQAFANLHKNFLPSTIKLEAIEYLGDSAFAGNKNTTLYEIPMIKFFGSEVFSSNKDDVKIRINSFCPFPVNKDAFKGITSKATLIIPKGTMLVYQKAFPWSIFTFIQESDTNIETDENNRKFVISDEMYAKRLKSIVYSKAEVSRLYLQEILKEASLDYVYLESNNEYEEVMKLFCYNRSFVPAIISDLEQRTCKEWPYKFKLKLAECSIMTGINFLGEKTNSNFIEISQEILQLDCVKIDKN